MKTKESSTRESGAVDGISVPPMDEHNQELVSNVHPPSWANPDPAERYNLVAIGAGSAGLVSAAIAAGLGGKVALVERHLLGGDCLNVGCVPSKAVIRSARAAADVRDAERFGVRVPQGVEVDFAAAMERMRRIRAGISHHDSAARFRDLGIDVFLGDARFLDATSLQVGERVLRFKKAVIATGGRPIAPPIPGLEETGYLNNETVFNLTARPARLAVIGGGPIGAELSQSFQRLGSRVTLLDMGSHILSREDADAAQIVQSSLQRDGVDLVLDCRIERVEAVVEGKRIHLTVNGEPRSIVVDEILVGVGRAPNVEGLGLEAAGVRYDRRGVEVNDNFQTSVPQIYAAGDVCMRWKFTHAADAAARAVVRNALLLGRQKQSALVMPWCTYTDPEIAHVGLYEHEARERGVEIDTFMKPFSEVDRALAEGDEEGFVKVHVKKGSGQILGATIVAPHAGEMISEITLAMVGKIGLGTLNNVIHPYPTEAEAIRAVAGLYLKSRFSPFLQKVMKTWMRWTR